MVNNVEYRYELKYVITKQTADILKRQLSKVMYVDTNAKNNDYSYEIRSLYFDDPFHTAYQEKVNGEEFREKFRIRMYNFDESYIRLECKHKDMDMTYKESCITSKEVVQALIDGKYLSIRSNNEFMNKFLAKAVSNNLRPSVIVDYKRIAFTYPTSDVRITFDENLRSGMYNLDFFDPYSPTYPMYPQDHLVLEVKCNEFIPAHILAILTSVPSLRQAVSKFAVSSSIK